VLLWFFMKVWNSNKGGVTHSGDGFSLTELVVAMAVALVLMGMGMPAFLRAYHTYQLSNAASRVADILRFTRYEAIRMNTTLSCQIQPYTGDPTMTSLWADSIKNNLPDPTEQQILLGSGGNLVAAAGVPSVPALIAAANITSATTAVPPSGTPISFDARGAVLPLNPPGVSVYVFYLASATAPEAGYRAVLLMPAGSIQVWTGDANGNWQQVR
jgi:prepilin-type N-terminal cleavage/methylation domain-containing protein